MKKKVFLCVCVSLMLFAASAKQSTLIDFFTSGGKEINTNFQKRSAKEAPKQNRSSPKKRKQVFEGNVEVLPMVSDKMDDSLVIEEQRIDPIQLPLKIDEENRIDEVFVNSFRGVTSISDLLKNIESNVESLAFGRMSNDDYNKLLQKKKEIVQYKQQYDKSVLAYDKICAMEKIFMNYNAVSEISVHFLSDISDEDIGQVQEALFDTEAGVMGDGLTYIFKTPISKKLKKLIESIHEKLNGYDLNKFTQKLLKELDKIPRELLDSEQYEKLNAITKELHDPIAGDFKTKCSILHKFVESYDELKSIPFRLKKISSDSIKNLALKAIEDMFFEKMLNVLRIMDGAGLSSKSENDAVVIAALNIKKSICDLLGGVLYSGKEYKSNIERFRTTDSIYEKRELLKKSISKFNKTVDRFKIAVASLKEEGNQLVIKDFDAVSCINEDIDRIFEKITIYEKNTKKEMAGDFQKIVIGRPDINTSPPLPIVQTQIKGGNNAQPVVNVQQNAGQQPVQKAKQVQKEASQTVLQANQKANKKIGQTADQNAKQDAEPEPDISGYPDEDVDMDDIFDREIEANAESEDDSE